MDVRRWVGSVVLAGGGALALAACHGGPHSLTVNTTADGRDAQPGNGVCEVTAGAGDCSLRAAVDEANAGHSTMEIQIPQGTYVLTLPGTDDTNAGGDLDLRLAGTTTLVGQGAGASIRAPGLDGVIDARQGTASLSKVSVSGATGAGLTVRTGASATIAFSSFHHNGGAGVRLDGGTSANALHSTFSTNGAGGVRTDGSLAADYVTITANTGGGIVGAGSAAIGQSVVATQASGGNCAFATTSRGWNASNDQTCGFTGTGDTSTSVLPLQALSTDLVPFHLPAPGSILMDAIPTDSGVCGSYLKHLDQRSKPRPVGRGCDKGAVEPGGLSFTVNSAADVPDANPGDGICDIGNGTCTVRAAITEANTTAGPDVVTLASSPTITRTGAPEDANLAGDLDVLDFLTIHGAGHTIDGGGVDRVIDHRLGSLEISDTSITGGWLSSPDLSGGGIASSSVGGLRLLDVDVWGNVAVNTGGVRVWGTLVMERSVVRDNRADQHFGGVSLASTGTSTIVDSTIAGNHATNGSVGGLSMSGGVDLVRSTVSGNRAKTAGGGVGINSCATRFDLYCRSLVEISSSTISGNSAQTGGGVSATLQTYDSVAIVGSTIVDNVATGNPTLDGRAGGGIHALTSVSVRASIVANNTGRDCWFPVATLGSNLDRDSTCGFGSADRPSTDPLLAPLADNGGPTRTHLPYAISPVLDAIPAGTAGLCDGSLPIDQRGQPRPVGTGCDVGAVEGNDPGPLPMALVVDTAADGADTAPGDHVCAAAAGCTLRAAISEVNASPHPSNRITIAPGVNPTLSIAGLGEDGNATGDLDLRAPVTVVGGGATINGAGLDRVLDIASTGVAIGDVTIRGGRLNDVDGDGAGVLVRNGGLVLERSTVIDNRIAGTSGRGAGLAALPSTTVTIRRSTFTTNYAWGFGARGGALYAEGANVTVLLSTLSGNHAFYGGAIEVAGTNTLVDVRASTITANTGWSTITGGYAPISLRGTVIGPGTTKACGSPIGADGTSTSFDSSCGFSPTLSNVNPLLDPLADNGGPTRTHHPQLESPLRDRIVPGADCEQTSPIDQRGQPRPSGTGCDIGSFEGP